MPSPSPLADDLTSVVVQFNILELYSGIGGFHYAIQKLFDSIGLRNYRIVAVDINTTANAIYRHNHIRPSAFDPNNKQGFSSHILLERNIQSFTVDELDQIKLNLLTMSPPCQPFSRLGLKRDLCDNRCDSFRHLMNILPLMQHKPEYIILENVKGFETSEAHRLLCDTLNSCDYQYKQYLLSPNQLSIPNSRQRYYLLARRHSISTVPLINDIDVIQTTVPVVASNISIFEKNAIVTHVEHIVLNQQFEIGVNKDELNTIEQYLETDLNGVEYELGEDTLARYHMLLDIVDRNSMRSNCFTKSYAHRIEGTGSVLKSAPDNVATVDEVYAKVVQLKATDQSNDIQQKNAIVKLLASLQLRYFTPREVANLMCFPPEFEFPTEINRKQRYRVLGNSVNVLVCYYLLRILLGLHLKEEGFH